MEEGQKKILDFLMLLTKKCVHYKRQGKCSSICDVQEEWKDASLCCLFCCKPSSCEEYCLFAEKIIEEMGIECLK